MRLTNDVTITNDLPQVWPLLFDAAGVPCSLWAPYHPSPLATLQLLFTLAGNEAITGHTINLTSYFELLEIVTLDWPEPLQLEHTLSKPTPEIQAATRQRISNVPCLDCYV